jgi:hypothetical protein
MTYAGRVGNGTQATRGAPDKIVGEPYPTLRVARSGARNHYAGRDGSQIEFNPKIGRGSRRKQAWAYACRDGPGPAIILDFSLNALSSTRTDPDSIPCIFFDRKRTKMGYDLQ